MALIKKWISYKNGIENLSHITDEFQIPELVARVMINRGIDTVPKARAFLNTDLGSLYDPYLMKGMDTTVARILDGIIHKEKICVYGDYDVDGITSTVIMLRTLKKLGADAVYYIPNRMEEGYGLSDASMDKIKALGVNLIITVDCGIRSNEVVYYAKNLGMDIIITDHHECEGELPDALSIVNPHQPGCNYPFKELAGVGVSFKLSSALFKRTGNGDFAEEFLDIVTIGTIADVVPLLGENRVIVKNGLYRIRNTRNVGISALLEICGLKEKELNTFNVAFMLAPRINAAGRISDAEKCVELLLTEDKCKALEIAEKLDADNRERQAIENTILNSAAAIIEEELYADKDRVLVLSNDNWHIGVIGIVASRLVDRFYLPTFIISCDGELCKGSSRSIPGFNIFEAMSRHGNLFEKYGGHEMAAGFSIKPENIKELRNCMNLEAEKVLGRDKPKPVLFVDYKLTPKDITLDTVRQLKLLEPFGTGNASPLFVYRGLSVISYKAVGNERKHLSFTIYDGVNEIKCIAYNFGSMQRLFSIGTKIDIICSIENNIWNGGESVQLNVKDIKLIK